MEKVYWKSVYENSYWSWYTVDTKLEQTIHLGEKYFVGNF